MKILKNNQLIIYALAAILVIAGYFSFTTNNKATLLASSTEEEIAQTANIGDAQLVSSNIKDDKENIDDGNNNNNNNNNNAINNNNSTMITTNSKTENEKKDYFTTSKLERDKMFSQMLETYENVLNSTTTSETQKQSAQDEMVKLNNNKNSIMICENLIQTKGFKNSVIFINGDSVSVIVQDDDLTQEDVSQIQNIIQREINTKVENIHISNK